HRVCSQAIGRVFEPGQDCFELHEAVISDLTNLTDTLANNRSARPIGEFKRQTIAELQEALTSGKPAGVPVRNRDLQSLTNGFKRGHLIVIGARPGAGKTAAVLEFCEHPAL